MSVWVFRGCLFTISWRHISQGKVATRLRCGGIFNYHFIADLSRSLTMKEFWHKFTATFFMFHSVYRISDNNGHELRSAGQTLSRLHRALRHTSITTQFTSRSQVKWQQTVLVTGPYRDHTTLSTLMTRLLRHARVARDAQTDTVSSSCFTITHKQARNAFQNSTWRQHARVYDECYRAFYVHAAALYH